MTQELNDTPELSRPRDDTPLPMISDDFVSIAKPAESQPSTTQEPPLTSDDVASQRDMFELPPLELRELNLAIEIYPEAAVNYAARGDYFRRKGEREQALSDYEQALAITESELARGDWALVSQAVRDQVLNTLAEMGIA